MANYADIVGKTLVFEGGYQNYANDSANYTKDKTLVGTNRGISAIAYEQYLGRKPTVADMKAITPEIAKQVYKKLFWDKMLGDQIQNNSVAWIMFDSLIATGNLKLVRSGINQVRPGSVDEGTAPFNAKTIQVVNSSDQKKLFEAVKNLNIAQRKRLAEQNPSKYGMFLKGWLNRLDDITFSGAALSVGLVAIIAGIYFLVK
jgi:lysozyme family protein